MGYVVAFAISMGFMEAAVVIYLRAIYYKDGFQFPLRPMDISLATAEVFREAATLVMLICIGYLAGKTKLQRFAYFNLAFAIWDIFYYVFLYIFLDWPQSLFTWDLLFLIPLPWVGPVWTPCLLCLLMIVGSVFIIAQTEKNNLYSIKIIHWLILILGASICILAFMWDYLRFCSDNNLWIIFSSQVLFSEMRNYIPQSFNYFLFLTGFALMSYPVILNILLTYKTTCNEKK